MKIRETECRSDHCCSLGHIRKGYGGVGGWGTDIKICCPKNEGGEGIFSEFPASAKFFWHPRSDVGPAMPLAAIRYSTCIGTACLVRL